MAGTRFDGAIPHACQPTGRGVGNTSGPCGEKTDDPDAPQRSGEASNHRRSDARGGDLHRPQRTSGGRVAQPPMGEADRADNSIRWPGPRLCEPSKAGDRDPPLPSDPHRPPRRQNRFTHSPVWVEGLCHQHHARAAVFAGCSLVLPPRIPYRTHLQSPQEPCAYRAAVCQAQRPNRGPHVPVDARRPRADGYGVYAAAVSAKRSSQTPRFAPRKQAQDDRQADGGADPESVCTCVPDHRKGSLVISGVHNYLIFQANKAYPDRSRWIRWNKCLTFTIPYQRRLMTLILLLNPSTNPLVCLSRK